MLCSRWLFVNFILILLAGCGDDIQCPDKERLADCAPNDSSTPIDDTNIETSDISADTGIRQTGHNPIELTEPLDLCINEFMAANANGITWEDQTPDWVEIHNHSADSVSLKGWSISDDPEDPLRHPFSNGLTIPAGGFLLLYADESPDLGETHLGFRLSVDGEFLVLTSPDGQQSTLSFPALEDDVSAMRTSDCCRGEECWTYEWSGTPGETNGEKPIALPEDVVLVPSGHQWRYLDDGSDLPSQWVSPTYDDSGWAEGTAPLGYGDKHITTEVSYGVDEFSKHITTYFRAEFDVTDPASVNSLTLDLMYDDGAVAYLNEVVVARSNMPPGPIAYDTLAVDTIWKVDEEMAFVSTDLAPALLLAGENQLAIEVHQAIPDSSDLGFDLGLAAEIEASTNTHSDNDGPMTRFPIEVLPAYSTPVPQPCPTLYDPDILPEFSIEIANTEWAALQFEYNNAGYGPSKTELKPYHPLDTFEYEGEVITNAEIRLKGWPGSYVDWGKMQFVIRFNGIDSAGRFQGLRHLALDSPYYEDSLLRERLSLTYFHQDLGLPGSCVNSARLVVNGQYYGLYTNIEYPDEELLERLFGNNGPDEGYLYKYVPDFGWKLKEGGEEDDLTAIDDLYATYEFGPIQKIIDVEHHLRFAAAEAVLPDEDNYFVGSINYAWYQHPTRGWMLLPWDHDWSFLTPDLDPRDPPFTWLNEHLWVLVHSPLSADYDIAIQEAIDGYDPALFSERLQTWAAQVRPSANADPSLPISEFEAEVARLEAFFWERHEYLENLFSE